MLESFKHKRKNKKIVKAFKNLEKKYNINLNVQANKTLASGFIMLATSAVFSVVNGNLDYTTLGTFMSGVLVTIGALIKSKKNYDKALYSIARRSTNSVSRFNMIELLRAQTYLNKKGVIKSDDDIYHYLASVVDNNADYLKNNMTKKTLKKYYKELQLEMQNGKEK